MTQSIDLFIKDLASEKPAPGGGATAALVGALGTALASMVANLTLGRKRFKDQEPLMLEILQEAKGLQESLIRLMEEDAQAYGEVSAVFKMPKETHEEKAKRKEALEKALKHATYVPYTIMEKAVAALRLHQRGIGFTNPSVVSDTGVGGLCLKTALMAAHLNVKINLASISDQAFVKEYEEKAQALLREGMGIADELYNHVIGRL